MKGSWDILKNVDFWANFDLFTPFDLQLLTNKNFWNDDTYASLMPLFASSFVQKIKKS